MVQASVSTGPLGDATRGDVARLLGRSFTVRDVVNGPDGVTAIVEDDVPHDHRIASADDPFFCYDALQKSPTQTAAQLKCELRVTLHGEREIAAGSLDQHDDCFSRSYDHTAAEGTRPFSGCFAIGGERLTFALFCRHGTDLRAWPRPVRDAPGLQ